MKTKIKLLTLALGLLCALALPPALRAQGLLDTTFANPNLSNFAAALAVDGSGKILVGGFFHTAGSGNSPYNSLARFNADGTLDTTFANPNLNNFALALAVDGSGKILVCGFFTTAGSGNSSYAGIARFNADGTLDTTFANPNLNNFATALAVDGSGKILVGGNFSTAGSGNSSYNSLARFNADGTLDTTFANPNLNNTAYALAVDGSGKILVGGFFTTAGSGNSSYNFLARFTGTGLSIAPTISATSTGNNLTLLWPDSATGYRVESTLSFTPSVIWNNVTGTFQTNGGSISIALPMTGTQKFYRLIKP